ncbi:MAG: hypothetical protein EBQ63_01135 [Actinobacteria bacterium]|nr:hypothetical protein [Actinomycetota bacterium]
MRVNKFSFQRENLHNDGVNGETMNNHIMNANIVEQILKFLHSPGIKSMASYLIRQLLNLWGL